MKIPNFRAWDIKEQRMIDINFWSIDCERMPILGDWDDAVMISDESRFIWLMSTGLTDRNGKEIHEGDVLENQSMNTYGGKNGHQYIRVEFKEAGSYTGFNITRKRAEKFEVIGNIYQHPWLVKQNRLAEI